MDSKEGTVLEIMETDNKNENKNDNIDQDECLMTEVLDEVLSSSSVEVKEETKICVKPEMEVVQTEKSEEENLLKGFKSVCNFVKALNDVFGDRCPSLQLYSHLLEKTGLIHEDPIKKHIGLFRHFCKENELFIMNKDYVSFQSMSDERSTIQYSDKVFINMKKVFSLADKEQLETIYNHLLTISAVLVPNSKAKKVLKEMKNKSSSSSDSKSNIDPTEFIANIFKKISENVNLDSSNPMEMITSLMSSGVLTDIMSMMNDGMGNGSLDIPKLLSTLQSFMTMFQGVNGGDNAAANGGMNGMDMSNLGPLMEMMKTMGGNGGHEGSPNTTNT
jgi:effector-binding domain-containing protein